MPLGVAPSLLAFVFDFWGGNFVPSSLCFMSCFFRFFKIVPNVLLNMLFPRSCAGLRTFLNLPTYAFMI